MMPSEPGGRVLRIRLRWWYPAAVVFFSWLLFASFRDSPSYVVPIDPSTRHRPSANFKPLPTLDTPTAPIVKGLPGVDEEGLGVEVTPKPDARPTCLLYSYFNLSEFFECAADSHLWCQPPSVAPDWASAPEINTEQRQFPWRDILIAVTTDADRLPYLDAMAKTWLPRVGADAQLVIAGSPKPEDLPAALRHRPNTAFWELEDLSDYLDLDKKVKEVFRRVQLHFGGRKYFIKMDDDTLLVPKNLYRLVAALDRLVPAPQPLYFGKANCGPKDNIVAAGFGKFCHGQGGMYGLNLASLKLFNGHECGYWRDMKEIIERKPKGGEENDANVESTVAKWIENGRDISRYEDVMVARCLREAGDVPILGCESFFPQSPLNYLYIQRDGRVVPSRVKTNPISFHHVSPSAIVYLDKMMHKDGNFGAGEQFKDPEELKQLVKDCRKEGERMFCTLPND